MLSTHRCGSVNKVDFLYFSFVGPSNAPQNSPAISYASVQDSTDHGHRKVLVVRNVRKCCIGRRACGFHFVCGERLRGRQNDAFAVLKSNTGLRPPLLQSPLVLKGYLPSAPGCRAEFIGVASCLRRFIEDKTEDAPGKCRGDLAVGEMTHSIVLAIGTTIAPWNFADRRRPPDL